MRNLICQPTVRYNLLNEVDSFLNSRLQAAPKPTSPFRESEDGYTAVFHMPGLKKSDVMLSVVEQSLKLVAESEEGAPFRVNYDHVFELPEDADAGSVDASLEAGVLTVIASKLEPVQPEERLIELS